jgi:hypothetical protein
VVSTPAPEPSLFRTALLRRASEDHTPDVGTNSRAEADPSSELYVRAQGRISEMSRRAVAQVVAEVPFYGQLPREVIEGELTDYMMANVRLFLRVVREGRQPTLEELAGPLTAGERRAQEGVPLAAMLAAYLAASREAWGALVDLAHEDELQEVLAAGFHTFRYLEALLPAVSSVYLEERQAIYGEEREVRRELVAALMAGQPIEVLAERAQVRLAERYVVLSMALSDPSTSSPEEVTADVAGRRLVRAVQEVLDQHTGGRVMSDLNIRGGTALLPAGDLEPAQAVAGLEDLVVGIVKAAGSPVRAAASFAGSTAEIPAAATEAREIAILAERLDRPAGVYTLDDLLLEYQVSRPGPARARLAAKLEALVGQQHLIDALEAFIAHDHNARLAAQDLHVHPNTLHYRLHRIAEITGLDPTSPADVRVLAAAKVARKLADDE